MRKFITSSLLSLALSYAASAQSSVQSFVVSPNEIQDGYIVEKVRLKYFQEPVVSMVNAQYEDLSKQSVRPENLLGPEIKIQLGKERKLPFAAISIPAYRQNEGQWQRLKAFSLNIEESAGASGNKPPAKTTGSSGSVLAAGEWYKISIKERGVYKIDYDFIKNKLGVDPSGFPSENIRIFGNGGVMLPEDNAIPVPDDLVENAIVVADGGDNKIDPGDYILFYAGGPVGWVTDPVNKTFYHQQNLYEDQSYYFLNFDQGKGLRIQSANAAPSSNVTVTSYDDYQVYEKDLVNLGKFGKNWWGEDFSTDAGKQSFRVFPFDVGPLPDTVTFRIQAGSRSAANINRFTISLNGDQVGVYNLAGRGEGLDDDAATRLITSFRRPVSGTDAEIRLDYAPGSSTARGYLDFIEVISRKPLALANGFISFRDWKSVGAGHIAAFELQSSNHKTQVWEVTNPLEPYRMNGNLSGNTYHFKQDAGVLREYVAFDESNLKTPEFIEKTENQNLRGLAQTDYIIITDSELMAAAERLADFHRQNSQLRVTVATTKQVYNEFSSGSQDIAAIRNFVRMFYQRAGNDTLEMPRYLLLFGDASYDYKKRVPGNTNLVPTWETPESESAITSYCTDDFFSFLDDHENINSTGLINTMDIGVGRLPVKDIEAANKIVDKIISYSSPASLGPWRISATIMADDGDVNGHMEDGEVMAATINQNTNLYNETKVYVSALPVISTPGGTRCPDANKLINDQVYKGTFLMNYSGHGSITTLASERILTQDDFNTWKNRNQLPIMVTATCTFSKFDDPAYVSAGEQLIVKPDGGAVALFTTTQLVYKHLNTTMNVDFLNSFFRQYNGRWPSFGDAIRIAKNKTYALRNRSLENFQKFVLLGDPAMMPAFPKHKIETEAILDGNTFQPVDTLKALGKYQITGSVKNIQGNVLGDFNGRVYVTIYDKPRISTTLTGPQRNFEVRNNIIYKGKATVNNGLFAISFIAPKDLNYDFGKGKISYYAENGITDGAGSDTSITVGGFSDVIAEDTEGPVVKPFMNDSLFKDGGITGSSSVLYVQLFDESGINVSGNSIGHDLTAVLDGNISQPYVLNDYYETAPNDYKRGYVFFPVSGLADGKHSIRVKAWDMFNNSGEGEVNFEVYNGKVVRLQNLLNYPNPFRDQTRFLFEHNHPGELLDVRINIYSTSGYLVRNIEEHFTPGGSRSAEILWDGTDNNGAKLPAGIYIYRLNLATSKGIEATGYQKLVLIR